jgi:methionyl-tRNA synthetase
MKLRYIFLIIAGVLIVVGGILLAIGITNNKKEEMVTKTYNLNEQFENIDINLDNEHDALMFEIYNDKTDIDVSELSYSLRYRTDKENKFKNYIKSMKNVEIREGIKIFMEISSLGNAYLQTNQPWNLLKQKYEKYDPLKAETIFYILNAFIRFLGALAEPFIPSFSAKLYEILNIKYEGDSLKLLGIINEFIEKNPNEAIFFLEKIKLIEEGQAINKAKPLFKEITQEEANAFKERFKGNS